MNRENASSKILSMSFFPGSSRKLLESQRDRKIRFLDHLEMRYGGPWNFNEIIGFIRLHFLGSQIRGEYFAVTDLTGSFCTKRNVRNRLGREFCHGEEEV
jgi:hypothetical protein